MERTSTFKEILSTFTADEKARQIYAEHLDELFGVIVPERIGEDFKCCFEKGDLAAAIKACADYYRQKPSVGVRELTANGSFNKEAADKTVEGYAREVNIDWHFPNGDMDFLFNPTIQTPPVNHEWLWQFNRHGYWANMARAYIGTGDEKYAEAFKKQILKWISQTYIPEKWNAPGSAWRTIECGLRLMNAWQVAFDGFRRSDTFDDISLLLMIASMHRQSTHLVAHPTGKNWLMMEANGIYAFSALFTELSDSEENRGIATAHLLRELEGQILPDGMHNELSPDYQSVVLGCAANFYVLADQLGLSGEIPKKFCDLMKSTVDAAVLLSTPAFTQPRTNDCYTIPTDRFTKRAEAIFGNTPKYRFVNTKRAEGEPPKGETASAFLPYAGFAVMRSDWGEDATYMCFDVGPLGMAHVHQDKLNINIYKGNEELIFDDGGGQYEISAARTYALSGYGHNTVLVDGLAQCRKGPGAVTEPIDANWISNAEFDYAAGTYDDPFGNEANKPATHKRQVRFCKPGFFCVSDILTSTDGNAHDYEALFHLDTTKVKTLTEYKNGVISEFGRKYEIVMIPLDSVETELKTVSAQTEPQIQGWYNGRNENNLHKAITVSRVAHSVKNATLNTLFFPVKNGGELPMVEKTVDGRVSVSFEGKNYVLDLNALDR